MRRKKTTERKQKKWNDERCKRKGDIRKLERLKMIIRAMVQKPHKIQENKPSRMELDHKTILKTD